MRMNSVFHVIDKATWERNPYFEYYYKQIKCRYTITANVDITALREYQQDRGMKFFPLMLYVIMAAVNQNKEFRFSFDGQGNLGYWEEVVPCYTLFHDRSKTFTDIWSDYDADVYTFYHTVTADMQRYKDVSGVIKARPDQPPNFCPVSALPWLNFTSFAQDTYTENNFLFPLIKFGKYVPESIKTIIPVAISVSHAVADGYHTCKLINDMQAIADTIGT